jgi:hypothetical protein
MRARWIFLALLSAVSQVAVAAEGLTYAAAYECQAMSINHAMSKVCSSAHPALADRATRAYASWLTRNADKAAAAIKVCKAQVQQYSQQASTKKDAAFYQQQMDGLKREIIASFKAKVVKDGVSVCEDALGQLETAGGPVDFK